MSNRLFRFDINQDSSAPSTPDRRGGRNLFRETTTSNSSTTPAGAPPSRLFDSTNGPSHADDEDLGNISTASFTPAGAPSAKYLGGSIMRGLGSSGTQPKGLFTGGDEGKPKGLFSFGTDEGKPKGLFTSGDNSQPKGLFTSGDGSQPKGLFTSGESSQPKGLFTSGESQPKGLFTSGESSQPKGLFTGLGGSGTGKGNGNSGLFSGVGGGLDTAGGFTGTSDSKNLFGASLSKGYGAKKSSLARAPVRGPPRARQPSRLSNAIAIDDQSPQPQTRTFGVPLDDEGDSEPGGDGDDEEGDMWLDMPSTAEQDPDAERAHSDSGSDLMMMATPAALERVRREAEDIYRASSFQAGGPARTREFRYAALAKDEYTRMGTAPLTEPPYVILGTENLLAKLYDEGVGEGDDEEKLDDTLATVAGKATVLWKGYVDTLPLPSEDRVATIGPGPDTTPFEKAWYLANLVLQIHHTRCDDGGLTRTEPLPETLFRWLNENHDMYGNQIDEILRFRPSPACHSLFWAVVFMALLRGRVADAARLLSEAGWAHVRHDQRGESIYTGRALDNVQRAVDQAITTLESCPGYDGNWDIWSSDWTLFRVRAQGALEHLRRFAEGRDNVFGESTSSARSSTADPRQSMAGLARRAESQVPWEIYEKLNVLFDIVLGQEDAILGAAQDWLEATVGLFCWWDECRSHPDRNNFSASRSLSRSQALVLASEAHTAAAVADTDSYLDRLARTFHMAVESDFHFDSQNPVEIGMACAFEGNVKGVTGLLRSWSLPVAAAVAEIASLGKWLPPHQPTGVYALEEFDETDLDLLGVAPRNPDDVDGIKDSTLVQYALALSEYEGLSVSREGWELSMGVLGRMDSPERSEEMVRDLVEHLIQHMHVDSSDMVDRLWGMLNELGMVKFAEDTAETYGDILARDSHRYGEAMWYYALAHRPNKVREVMNLLISYSLVQSTAFPPANELDDYLRRLLTDRKNTLEQCASQDMEAAELLGKMLSGYASLRQFYDIRDNDAALAHASPRERRRQAATALVSVIASSDDNIRGGLFDQTRDGIVSEDFLLALLGEALVFVSSDPDNNKNTNTYQGQLLTNTPILTLDQIDVLLKSIEDLQAVSSRVYTACDEFLQLVLASAPGGLKGSTPADLLRKSTAGGGNATLAGSSLVASQLQKSLSGAAGALGKAVAVKRGWDWRKGVAAKTKGEDVLKRLRLGLARDLAGLWLAEADDISW
ncbi:hypothetical protein VTJ49DRAFT_4577 [Mycothermus thermophilus]|uniref:Nuclear pore complex protein Nup85 n=1 Tax=Humicola insolens TaxID=85995 RepID=A0ABR3VMF4_HUMIN